MKTAGKRRQSELTGTWGKVDDFYNKQLVQNYFIQDILMLFNTSVLLAYST
jgi:hypothetical protein